MRSRPIDVTAFRAAAEFVVKNAGERLELIEHRSFIDACERVTPSNQTLLQQVQLAEWQLLFHYCAKAE